MWTGKLQNSYTDFDEFQSFDTIYHITERLGYDDPERLWNDNSVIQGSVNPADFKIISGGKTAICPLKESPRPPVS